MTLPSYTKKDFTILAVVLPPVVVLINALLFSERFFTNGTVFLVSGLIVSGVMLVAWFLFTWIAVTLRNRLPSNKDLIKRLAITILAIGCLQALIITLFFQGYDHFNILDYEINEERYYITLGWGFLLNITITLIHEGFESFEKWKATLTETEQLKKAYTQSQLLGLKSQVNPHFLFNSLNSLSSLISEDEKKAEIFLNEMTKVYRYLLRGTEEKLVTLETELRFIRSYYYLLNTRYGDSIRLYEDVDEYYYNKYVTPLLLQTIVEYGFNTNRVSKESPLNFMIKVDERGWLYVEYNIQYKQNSATVSTEGIFNLMEKYKLISGEQVEMDVDEKNCVVKIPLLEEATINLI